MAKRKTTGFAPVKNMEDMKKDFKQTYIIEAIVLGIGCMYFFLSVYAYMADHPRADLFSAMGEMWTDIGENPFYFFPVRYDLMPSIGFTLLVEMFVILQYTYGQLRLHANPLKTKGRTVWGDAKEFTSRYAEKVKIPNAITKFIKVPSFLKSLLPFLRDKEAAEPAYNNAMMSKNFWTSIDAEKHFKALNTLILGSSGAGKTRFWLKPNLLQMNCSYAITDPKGEILDSCGEILRRNGYNIKIFDIVEQGNCDTYNPLKYCRKESDIKKIVTAFMKNTDTSGGKGGNKDPFWDDSMSAFLCAAIGFLVSKPEGSDLPYAQIPEVTGGKCYEAVFPNLCELTRMANKKWTKNSGIELAQGVELGDGKNATANASELAAIFENLRAYEAKRQGCSQDMIEKPYCLREWENFRIAPEKTSTTILMTAAVRLDPFNIEQIKNLTCSDTMDLDSFAIQKTALFLIMPATDRTYNFLLAFIYTQLFDILYQFGEKKIDGSKYLSMKNGEFVKWFSREEVKEGKADEFMDAVKTATAKKIVINGEKRGEDKKTNKIVKFDDSYYEIILEDGTVLTRRQTKKDADAFLTELKTLHLQNGVVPKLPMHFRFLIDEFPNIGEIPDFKGILSTVRGYNVSATVICQTITQLKGIYPDDYEQIDANCPFTVFLGGDENSNNEYLSKKIGSTMITGMNNSVDQKKVNSSYNTDEAKLLNPEDLGRIPFDHEVVMVYGEMPIYDKKFDLVDHRYYKQSKEYLKKCNIDAMNFERTAYGEKMQKNNRLTYIPEKPSAVPEVSVGLGAEGILKKIMEHCRAGNEEEAVERANANIMRYAFEESSAPMGL